MSVVSGLKIKTGRSMLPVKSIVKGFELAAAAWLINGRFDTLCAAETDH